MTVFLAIVVLLGALIEWHAELQRIRG